MTENTIFNSSFEIGLRVLLLLSAAKKKAFSAERIVALDFITCYASNFQMPFLNLQGDNQYMYSELASRRERVREAVRQLVLEGLLDIGFSDGYVFSISAAGSKFIRKLKSEYAVQYKTIAAEAIRNFKGKSDLELDRMLNDSAVMAARGGR